MCPTTTSIFLVQFTSNLKPTTIPNSFSPFPPPLHFNWYEYDLFIHFIIPPLLVLCKLFCLPFVIPILKHFCFSSSCMPICDLPLSPLASMSDDSTLSSKAIEASEYSFILWCNRRVSSFASFCDFPNNPFYVMLSLFILFWSHTSFSKLN